MKTAFKAVCHFVPHTFTWARRERDVLPQRMMVPILPVVVCLQHEPGDSKGQTNGSTTRSEPWLRNQKEPDCQSTRQMSFYPSTWKEALVKIFFLLLGLISRSPNISSKTMKSRNSENLCKQLLVQGGDLKLLRILVAKKRLSFLWVPNNCSH